ncbi:MAG: hypothetical protein K2X93_06785 [Candidatus Obscuribacterales bacterium]|nr:hypothetical protein [Candidatus Obscuribacterales bacterium]
MEMELTYDEKLTIRRGLDLLAARHPYDPVRAEQQEAERLNWLFKDAKRVVVETE